MNDYVSSLLDDVKAKNPAEPEFHQAVQEVAESLALVLDRHPEYIAGVMLINPVLSEDEARRTSESDTRTRCTTL